MRRGIDPRGGEGPRRHVRVLRRELFERRPAFQPRKHRVHRQPRPRDHRRAALRAGGDVAVAGIAVAFGVAERGGGEAFEVEDRPGGELDRLERAGLEGRQLVPERPLVAQRQVREIGRVERVEVGHRPDRQEPRRAAAEPGRRGHGRQNASLQRLLHRLFRDPREEGGLADGQVGG